MNQINDARVLFILNQLEGIHNRLEKATDARIRRQDWINRIKTCAERGKVAVIVWSRDCDMCEGTSRTLVKATVKAVDEFCERQYRWAEGPMTFSIERPSMKFKSEFRDRAMEAFENGRGANAYCV